MDATPKSRFSRRSTKGKNSTAENTYAAPQQPEYWDAASGQWVQHAPGRGTTAPTGRGAASKQPVEPAQRRARRINPNKVAEAQPYEGPRPDADWQRTGGNSPAGVGYGGAAAGYRADAAGYAGAGYGAYRAGGAAGVGGPYPSGGSAGGGYPPYGSPYDDEDDDDAEEITPLHTLRRIGKTIKWVLIIAIILTLVGGTAGAITFSTNVARVDALSEHLIGRTSGTNWLLVGSDSRAGLTARKQEELDIGGDLGSQRTDTIMLMHIPYGGGQRVLVSIPRDSYVNIPGHGMGKINSAFSLGGAQLLVKTIEQAAGVHIDHYMEVGFSGFADMTDALEGVEICPKYPINDPYAGLYIDAGCQLADGKVALGYVRTRQTPRGDLDRVTHQREFLESFVKKATSPATILNPLTFFPLMKAAGASLTLDKRSYVISLGWLILNLTRDHIVATIPIGDMVTNEAGAVVLWNDETTQFWGHIAQGTDIPEYLLSE